MGMTLSFAFCYLLPCNVFVSHMNVLDTNACALDMWYHEHHAKSVLAGGHFPNLIACFGLLANNQATAKFVHHEVT